MQRLATVDADFAARFAALLSQARETTESVAGSVSAIIEAVRAEGDAALCRFTSRFDRVEMVPERLAVTAGEIAAAKTEVAPALLAALDLAARRIEAFHRAQMPRDLALRDAEGFDLGMRWTPLDAVGLYVPGGKAAYPSSVLMNALPARVAGVERLVMTVPAPDGRLNPLVLAAAERAGVSEIYRIGGAQAVAALAYGTERIRPVDRITGPGNAYVAEAKRQVFGRVGIDGIAGPSEVVVLADGRNDPAAIAMDLLAQAEHDQSSQSILITDDAGFADAVAVAVRRALETLPRAAIAGESWERNGAIIQVVDWEEACGLVNCLAPEHVQVMIDEPEVIFARIRHAGAAFLGRHMPEAVGDYVAGPNHVLPTGRTARFASGLSVFDFLKRTTWVKGDLAALARVGPAAAALAEAEGLHGHAGSIMMRLQ